MWVLIYICTNLIIKNKVHTHVYINYDDIQMIVTVCLIYPWSGCFPSSARMYLYIRNIYINFLNIETEVIIEEKQEIKPQ